MVKPSLSPEQVEQKLAEWGFKPGDIVDHKILIRFAADPDHVCPKCGVTLDECSFCTTIARHFIEAKSITKTVYFCDDHLDLVSPDSESLYNEDYDTEKDRLEFGSYAPTDGCICDSWK